jgi:hypothetical protein
MIDAEVNLMQKKINVNYEKLQGVYLIVLAITGMILYGVFMTNMVTSLQEKNKEQMETFQQYQAGQISGEQ